MHRHALVDPGSLRGGMHGAVELTGAERFDRIESGKQPAAIEHLALGTRHSPPGAQALEQHRREHGVAILATLALLDAQRHALTVDVTDLERHHLARAQPSAVGHRERGLVLQVAGRSDQAGHFLAAQHHRQRLRNTHRAHLVHQFAVIERDLEEELQAGDRGIERDRRDSVIHQMQLIAPQILDTGGVGRAPEKPGKLAHRANVVALRLVRELAHAHVVDHAPAQRADALSR